MAPLRFYLCQTRLGWIGLALSAAGPDGRSLRASTLPHADPDAALRGLAALGATPGRASIWTEAASEAELGDLPQRLRDYAQGKPVRFDDVRIDWEGVTPFRRRVLAETRRIPPGEVRSYGWLARRVGQPRAARAVGRVMATNPLPIIIPCHRVVASDGSLGGYGGSPAMKEALLRLEGAKR